MNWPYADYAKIADYLLLMGYDEHWDGSRPGSIAGQVWFEDALDKRMKDLDPDRTIVAIGGYGYDWVKGQSHPRAHLRGGGALGAGLRSRYRVRPGNSNPHFSFIEDDGKRHDVWFLDGVTAFNEIQAGDAYASRRLCAVAVGFRRSLDLVGDGPALRCSGAKRAAQDRNEPGYRLRRRRRVVARAPRSRPKANDL